MTNPNIPELFPKDQDKPKTLALFDLGYVFRRYWHGSEDEEIGSARKRTVMFIGTEADSYDFVALCKDSPPYARRELYPEYKQNREKASSVMIEQLRRTLAELERWGYRVVGVPGQEADDVIATLAKLGSKAGYAVDIWTPDKDVRQALHWARTRIVDPLNGTVITGGDLLTDEKWGIPPNMIPSFLALVGDGSDNLPGIDGCGPKQAAKILDHYGSIEAIFENPGPLATKKLAKANVRTAIMEDGARAHLLKMRQLATLRDDLDLELSACVQSPKEPAPEQADEQSAEFFDEPTELDDEPSGVVAHATADSAEDESGEPVVEALLEPTPARAGDLVRGGVTALTHQHTPWERQLEPTDSKRAWQLAHLLHESRLYIHAFNSPQQILAVMLDGRSRGIDATTALRTYNVIKNRVSMSSELLIALVMGAPICNYFRCVESTPEKATWETLRSGYPEPDRLTYTIQEADQAGYTATRGSPGSWQKQPRVMLRWRGATTLARQVYPDITAGIYSVEEIEDWG